MNKIIERTLTKKIELYTVYSQFYSSSTTDVEIGKIIILKKKILTLLVNNSQQCHTLIIIIPGCVTINKSPCQIYHSNIQIQVL